MKEHDCFENGVVYYKNFETTDLLETTDWEFTLNKCVHCSRVYLRAYMDTDGFPQSGRWFIAELCRELKPTDINEKNLLLILHNMNRLYYGGTYWGGGGCWAEKTPLHQAYSYLERSISYSR